MRLVVNENDHTVPLRYLFNFYPIFIHIDQRTQEFINLGNIIFKLIQQYFRSYENEFRDVVIKHSWTPDIRIDIT